MTDRLTPPQLPAWALEDLSRFFTRDAEVHRQLLVTARMRSEAARREAEAKHVCDFVFSGDMPGALKCRCGRQLTPKEPGRLYDAAANVKEGGCDNCPTPTGCRHEQHCDNTGLSWAKMRALLATQGEREGPGSAAAPKCIHADDCEENGHCHGQCDYRVAPDKPAPAAAPKGWCPETETSCGNDGCVKSGRCLAAEDKPAPAADDLVARLREEIAMHVQLTVALGPEETLSRIMDTIAGYTRAAVLDRMAGKVPEGSVVLPKQAIEALYMRLWARHEHLDDGPPDFEPVRQPWTPDDDAALKAVAKYLFAAPEAPR